MEYQETRRTAATSLTNDTYDLLLEEAREVTHKMRDRLQILHYHYPTDMPEQLVGLLGHELDVKPSENQPFPGREQRSGPRFLDDQDIVTIVKSNVPEAPLQARVLNHSCEGLALHCSRPLPIGSVLWLGQTAPQRPPMQLGVEVKHCSPRDGGWVLGCHFLRVGMAQAEVGAPRD